ncbi:hypothetical protein [Streptomyces sp. Wh19]|uniref:hypothetical protein n=1 Tax=Streptomyces sp. Wh19 TaxID=3076629 RepID=UPI002958A60A|nr:hypothetical protein [Streptomyces sp. Wh19]MDV9194458.1 hypothetical protein [Streptomyces sp. Wh19]
MRQLQSPTRAFTCCIAAHTGPVLTGHEQVYGPRPSRAPPRLRKGSANFGQGTASLLHEGAGHGTGDAPIAAQIA